MAEETFSDLGRVEAIAKLYHGTPYKPFENIHFETSGKGYVTSDSRTFIEGIDFDLTYFPLKHLGYKCVTAATGELYAKFASPRVLDIRIGISAKLDFAQIKEVWEGIVKAAEEHGYKKVGLDLVPSPNGLYISVSVTGETSLLTAKRRPAAKSMDLICVSDNLGAAFMGFQVLERERRKFEQSGDAKAQHIIVGIHISVFCGVTLRLCVVLIRKNELSRNFVVDCVGRIDIRGHLIGVVFT